MAKTIPQLTDATTVNAADEIIIQQSGITKRATAGELMNNAPVTATGSTTARSLAARAADVVNVKDFGAVGNGVANDTAAINSALDFARPTARPVYLPAGIYRVTASLNFSGANDGNPVGWPNRAAGWQMYGDGMWATEIFADLSQSRPVIDRTGSHLSVLRDFAIRGASTGSQTCGVFDAEAVILATQPRSRECKLIGMLIAGKFTQAGYVNFNSDLSEIVGCYINGACGVVYTARIDGPFTGIVQSAFQTIGTNVNVTMHYITRGYISGDGNDAFGFEAAIANYDVFQLHIDQSYIAQTVDALYGINYINVSGGSDGATMSFTDGRWENQSNNDGTFLCVDCVGGLNGSTITGFLGNLPARAGQVIFLKNGGINGLECRVELGSSFVSANGGHFITRDPANATGVIRQSYLVDTSGNTSDNSLMEGIDAALFGEANIIQLRGWNSNWTNAANNNLFITRNGIYNWTNRPYFRIGQSAENARGFAGCGDTGWGDVNTTAAAGDESLLTYALPTGDIALANTTQNRVTLRLRSSGVFAANGNAKTLKVKFGVSGSETTILQNDITTSPNNLSWIIEADIMRADQANNWVYHAKMFVGSVLQTATMGPLAANPATNVVRLLITGDAALDEISKRYHTIEFY